MRLVSVRLTQPRRRVAQLAVVVGHFALVPGVLFALESGRPRFVGLLAYVIVSVAVFDVALIVSRTGRVQRTTPTLTVASSSLTDWRLLTALLFIGVAVLALVGKGLPYYLVITILFTAIILGILTEEVAGATVYKYIVLVAVSSALLLLSEGAAVAYYASTNDTIKHTVYAMRIAQAGTIDAIAATRYANLTIMHTLSAIGIQLTDLRPRVLIYLLTALVFQAALLASFLFLRTMSESAKLSLLGVTLMGFNIAFMRYGTAAHAQSLSFVFFTFVLFVLSSRLRANWKAALALPIMVAWIGTHHLSLAMGVGLLLLPVGFYILISRSSLRTNRHPISPRLYFLLLVLMVAYWGVLTSLFNVPLTWIFIHSPSAEGISTTKVILQLYDSPAELLQAAIPFAIDNIHYAFMLGFTGLGVRHLFLSEAIRDVRWQAVIIGFGAAAVFYFPNPAWIPLRGLGTLLRWGIMTLPLLVLPAAVGLREAARRSRRSPLQNVVVISLVAALVFTTIATGMSSPSIADLAGYDKEARSYISEEDLEAITFVQRYSRNEQPIYSTARMAAYIGRHRENIRERTPRNDRSKAIEQIVASGSTDRIVPQSGLTVFPVRAFREERVRTNVTDPNSEFYDSQTLNEVSITVPISAETYRWERQRDSVVYANGATVVQYVPTVENSTEEV